MTNPSVRKSKKEKSYQIFCCVNISFDAAQMDDVIRLGGRGIFKRIKD